MAKVPVEERTPYIVVAIQECERMNLLSSEIRRSLKELDLGLKVKFMEIYFFFFFPSGEYSILNVDSPHMSLLYS
jgi:hypothetical protein